MEFVLYLIVNKGNSYEAFTNYQATTGYLLLGLLSFYGNIMDLFKHKEPCVLYNNILLKMEL